MIESLGTTADGDGSAVMEGAVEVRVEESVGALYTLVDSVGDADATAAEVLAATSKPTLCKGTITCFVEAAVDGAATREGRGRALSDELTLLLSVDRTYCSVGPSDECGYVAPVPLTDATFAELDPSAAVMFDAIENRDLAVQAVVSGVGASAEEVVDGASVADMTAEKLGIDNDAVEVTTDLLYPPALPPALPPPPPPQLLAPSPPSPPPEDESGGGGGGGMSI